MDGFKVEGLNKVVRDLEDLGLDVEDLKEAFGAIAKEGAEVAAGFAPRRSGALQRSIRGSRSKNKAVIAAGTKAKVPYAGAQNYGWGDKHANYKHANDASGIRGSFAGHHFMEKTDADMSPKALELLEEQIAEQIKKRGL